MHRTDGTDTRLVGTVQTDLQLALQEPGLYELSGLDSERFTDGGRIKPGVANAWAADTAQQQREGSVLQVEHVGVGAMTTIPRAVKDVFDNTLDGALGGEFLTLFYQVERLEVIRSLLHVTDQRQVGVDTELCLLGFVKDFLQLLLIHLDRVIDRIFFLLGLTTVLTVATVVVLRRSLVDLGRSEALANTLDRKVQRVALGIRHEHQSVDTVTGSRTLLPAVLSGGW